ncbi:MAG TPA: hydrogenase expression/formation protein HypE [Chloroflexi bacterium]|jgi:hydrogenase expression/formation protein HypE|nr:hydrogenase expression/formation protein HypE [Chloroflexota bacterium]
MSDVILLAHGSGGLLSQELVETIFLPHLGHPDGPLEDAAEIALAPGRVVMTTDGYVVRPLTFPGGDIGTLAVCGTVNDLAMRGARPLYLTAGFILEEGFPLAELDRLVASMARAAADAGVRVVAGDTKVVERGAADGLFITTAGVGVVPEGVRISAAGARPGDVVLLSGSVGDHGLAILAQREGLGFGPAEPGPSPLQSDCAPLHGLVAAMLAAGGASIHALRDPTRGGLATALNELAHASDVTMTIDEAAVPIHDAVRAACDLLGLDPLYAANEGKLIAIAAPEAAEATLAAMRAHPLGAEAAAIGRVHAGREVGRVVVRTPLGTHRLLDALTGEQLPRIC